MRPAGIAIRQTIGTRRSTPACDGFGRVATTTDGRFTFHDRHAGTRRRARHGQPQAPHLLVSVLARGILTRLATRMYFEDEPANAEDPILALVPRESARDAHRRGARTEPRIAFDIMLQGPGETVFFDV